MMALRMIQYKPCGAPSEFCWMDAIGWFCFVAVMAIIGVTMFQAWRENRKREENQ